MDCIAAIIAMQYLVKKMLANSKPKVLDMYACSTQASAYF